MTSGFNFYGVFLAFMFLNDISIGVCKVPPPYLYVTNNSPAVTGANITFFALLSEYSIKSNVTYVFNDGVQSVSLTSNSLNVSLSLAFSSDLYAEGHYQMNVSVMASELWLFEKQVAFNYTSFDLQKSLIGEILMYQGNRILNEDVEKIAVGENFTAVVSLYDPNDYLKDAVIDYTWSFDMDHYFTSNNSFIYNFSDVGDKVIIVKPKATFPNFQTISGFFYKKLLVEVPVNHVNVSGNFFLHHGDFLKVNISCLGTPPFSFCSQVFKNNITVDNFTCSTSSTSFSNFCSFHIKKYLVDGTYQLGMYITNDITEIKRIIQIKVFPVTIKPALSTIIIPIVCSLLTLVIIAIGVSFYIKQRNQLAIEIADFDFQDESDSYAGERTFFEKIIDSIACRNCGKNQLSNRSESDPLLNDESLLSI